MEVKTVDLSVATLLRECSLDPKMEMDHAYYFALRNRENIHDVFKYKKFNDDFTSRVACYNTGSDIVGIIRPSYQEFLDKLLTILNIRHSSKIEDNDELTNKMLDRLEVLKQIKSERDLLKEFPILYRDLIDGRKYFNSLQKLRKQEGYNEDEYASGEHYYYSCALKKSLPNFIKTQSEMYKRYINNRGELKNKIENTSYNTYIRKSFDINKLYLYVVHEYLRVCESSKDKEEIKKYLVLIEKYLKSNINKTIRITTDEGIVIDYNNIVKRYENLKRVISDNSSLVNWVLVPEGRDYAHVRGEVHDAKQSLLTVEEVEKLRRLGERKTVFYESTPYEAKAIGLRRYRGYIAYIYNNGEVILDREFNVDTPSTAKDNAIYNLKVGDFEELSKLDKQVLMHHPKVGRMYHSKSWEDRVSAIIKKDETEESREEVKRLLKRLKEKNS